MAHDEDTECSEEELLDYSRYGDSVDLDVLLATGGVDVNYADEGGNTALHKVPPRTHSQIQLFALFMTFVFFQLISHRRLQMDISNVWKC